MIKSAKLVFKTWRDYAMATQDSSGNLFHDVGGGAGTNDIFDEVGVTEAYYLPITTGLTIAAPADIFKTSLKVINSIPMEKVNRCVIRKVSMPIGVDRELNVFNPLTKSRKIIGCPYIPTTFVLRPRIQVDAANYAAIITAWDSSVAIPAAIGNKLKDIADCYEYDLGLEFTEPIMPYHLNLTKARSGAIIADPNYPYCIINTRSVIEVEYYWEDGLDKSTLARG